MIKHLQDHAMPHPAPARKRRHPSHADLGDALLQEPSNPTWREQALWRAVIMQMLTDALSGSRKEEAQQHKREALVWLRGNTRDFRTVCDYAGFDPEYVRELAAAVLDRHTTAQQRGVDA